MIQELQRHYEKIRYTILSGVTADEEVEEEMENDFMRAGRRNAAIAAPVLPGEEALRSVM